MEVHKTVKNGCAESEYTLDLINQAMLEEAARGNKPVTGGREVLVVFAFNIHPGGWSWSGHPDAAAGKTRLLLPVVETIRQGKSGR